MPYSIKIPLLGIIIQQELRECLTALDQHILLNIHNHRDRLRKLFQIELVKDELES
jgi:hypothetical protein